MYTGVQALSKVGILGEEGSISHSALIFASIESIFGT